MADSTGDQPKDIRPAPPPAETAPRPKPPAGKEYFTRRSAELAVAAGREVAELKRQLAQARQRIRELMAEIQEKNFQAQFGHLPEISQIYRRDEWVKNNGQLTLPPPTEDEPQIIQDLRYWAGVRDDCAEKIRRFESERFPIR